MVMLMPAQANWKAVLHNGNYRLLSEFRAALRRCATQQEALDWGIPKQTAHTYCLFFRLPQEAGCEIGASLEPHLTFPKEDKSSWHWTVAVYDAELKRTVNRKLICQIFWTGREIYLGQAALAEKAVEHLADWSAWNATGPEYDQALVAFKQLQPHIQRQLNAALSSLKIAEKLAREPVVSIARPAVATASTKTPSAASKVSSDKPTQLPVSESKPKKSAQKQESKARHKPCQKHEKEDDFEAVLRQFEQEQSVTNQQARTAAAALSSDNVRQESAVRFIKHNERNIADWKAKLFHFGCEDTFKQWMAMRSVLKVSQEAVGLHERHVTVTDGVEAYEMVVNSLLGALNEMLDGASLKHFPDTRLHEVVDAVVDDHQLLDIVPVAWDYYWVLNNLAREIMTECKKNERVFSKKITTQWEGLVQKLVQHGNKVRLFTIRLLNDGSGGRTAPEHKNPVSFLRLCTLLLAEGTVKFFESAEDLSDRLIKLHELMSSLHSAERGVLKVLDDSPKAMISYCAILATLHGRICTVLVLMLQQNTVGLELGDAVLKFADSEVVSSLCSLLEQVEILTQAVRNERLYQQLRCHMPKYGLAVIDQAVETGDEALLLGIIGGKVLALQSDIESQPASEKQVVVAKNYAKLSHIRLSTNTKQHNLIQTFYEKLKQRRAHMLDLRSDTSDQPTQPIVHLKSARADKLSEPVDVAPGADSGILERKQSGTSRKI